MAKQRYRWWYGAIAGPLVGLALWQGDAAVNSLQKPAMVTNLSPAEFTRLITMAHVSPATAQVSGLTVYPPEGGRYLVTGSAMRPSREGMVEKSFEFTAATPFTAPPPLRFGVGKTYPTVREYFAEVAPSVGYRYAWWTEPRARAGMLIGVPAVLGGIVLPVLVELLMRLGVMKRPEPEEVEIPFVAEPEPAREEEPAAELSEADRALLDTTLATMEENLGTVAASASTTVDVSAAKPSEVRALTGGPVEAMATQAGEAKDYDAGAFYPVHRPKKREE